MIVVSKVDEATAAEVEAAATAVSTVVPAVPVHRVDATDDQSLAVLLDALISEEAGA